MKKGHLVFLLAVALLLVMVLVFPAAAAGSASKATGSGTWTNRAEQEFYAKFNAHEPQDNRPAKGWLFQTLTENNPDPGSFMVEVDQVYVYEGYACFGGNTVEASGIYSNRVGQYRWTLVIDGGEGVDAMDYLRGSWASSSSMPDYCASQDAGVNLFTSGNVQIHLDKSDA